MQSNGFARSNVQHFLKDKRARRIVVPLLVVSVVGPSQPLQPVIDLDGKGNLSHKLNGPYQLTIYEIKPWDTGVTGLYII